MKHIKSLNEVIDIKRWERDAKKAIRDEARLAKNMQRTAAAKTAAKDPDYYKNKFEPGHIVILRDVRNSPEAVVISWRHTRSGKSVDLILMRDLDKALAGEFKKTLATLKVTHDEQVEFTGKKITKAQLDKLIKLQSSAFDYKMDKFKERDSKLDFEGSDRVVVMQDGNKAKENDYVIVKFTNGNFPGYIKSFDGMDGWVMWVGSGKSKARSINPKNIVRKMTEDEIKRYRK